MCYSFDSQYRFNNAHQYNSSFGKNRSSYTETTESKLKLAYDELKQMDIIFMANNFKDFDFQILIVMILFIVIHRILILLEIIMMVSEGLKVGVVNMN